jgi:mono/diheme cytochrome c family protein
MMNKFWIISMCAIIMVGMISCNKVRRSPGRAYMPDMAYSRAIETYSSTEGLQKHGINSAGYINSKNITNPLPALDAKQFIEAARLYLINCGICHGEKLDGNGPLWKDGNGPYPAAPRNLLIDPVATMPEGTMFHSLTYGKNTMGSYASQLSTEQRWMIVHYIKEKQAANKPATPAPVADTAAAKKPN